MSALTSRLVTYYSRHGLWATAQRVGLALKRAMFFNRQVVFYCDLASHTSTREDLPSLLRVERKRTFGELSPQELHELIDFWNPKLARQKIEDRFRRGASLWLIKSEARTAGYIWTLQGAAISSFYFPLGKEDVQLFDLFLFPMFRGRGIDWLLFTDVFCTLAADGAARAFADTGEWNDASVSSHIMSRFQLLGCARKWSVFNHTIVWWTKEVGIRKIETRRREHRAPNRCQSDALRRDSDHSLRRRKRSQT
jgi:hypothetical protein